MELQSLSDQLEGAEGMHTTDERNTAQVEVRIPRISATQSRGMLPRNPWECCHPVQRISATQSTECCHPRSVATLDCMSSLCALLLSMALWRLPLRPPVSPRCSRGPQRRSPSMHRPPREPGSAASCWL
jgi:hypothetical protein